MTPAGAAQCLHNVLYNNRFFPKYAYCVLGGIDKDGKGKLYSYDPVGSYSKEGESRAAAGAASSLIVPFLDNQVIYCERFQGGRNKRLIRIPTQVEFKNQHIINTQGVKEERPVVPLDRDTVVKLVKDAFTGATERHIEVGDGLQIVTVSAQRGYEEEVFALKQD